MNHPIIPVKNSILLLLLVLLLAFLKGPNLVYGTLALLAVILYYIFTEHRFSPTQIAERGYMKYHLTFYMILCTLVIWATTGEEESQYWIIYVLPIVTGASALSLLRTIGLCTLASTLYLALIPAQIYNNPVALQEDLPEFLISCITLYIVGILVQSLAEQNRRQLLQEKQLNDQLSVNEEALRQSLKKLRETEENLRRQDRLAALGEMSAGLAHEIRNPLGIISSSAQLLHSTKTDQSDPALLTIIQEETTRLNRLISRFLDFGRPLQLHRKHCRLNALLEQLIDHVRGLATQKNLQLNAFLPSTPVELFVDTELIHQAILNLLLNAVAACRKGDSITVTLTQRNEKVHIAVEDSGSGIPAENLPQIFNPFFTTREQGSGLGLANANKAIALHGGTIDVHSRVGHGSTFTIVLPLEENRYGAHPHR